MREISKEVERKEERRNGGKKEEKIEIEERVKLKTNAKGLKITKTNLKEELKMSFKKSPGDGKKETDKKGGRERQRRERMMIINVKQAKDKREETQMLHTDILEF